MIQLHQLQPIHKSKKSKRLGRGGKRGTYCGRGIKGQKARAGRRLKPIIREIIKKYPKLRGYKFKPRVKKKKSEVFLNLETLEKKFGKQKVSPKILLEKKIISKIKGKVPKVKILGRGKLTKKLIVEGCEVSRGAKKKIEKAGGLVKLESKN